MNYGEQDYIRGIYEINEKRPMDLVNGEYLPIKILADNLNNTNQTTNEMIKKLQEKSLLEYKPYKGIKLTSLGHLEALKLIRIHRLWEVFLVEKLNFSWEEVHAEAHLLEHATKETLERKLYAYLDYPKYCPHGSPIPDFDGHMEKKDVFLLSEGALYSTYILYSVIDNHDLLTYLNNKEITLKTQFEIIEIDTFSHNVTILIHTNKKQITIGNNVASQMYIKRKD